MDQHSQVHFKYTEGGEQQEIRCCTFAGGSTEEFLKFYTEWEDVTSIAGWTDAEKKVSKLKKVLRGPALQCFNKVEKTTYKDKLDALFTRYAPGQTTDRVLEELTEFRFQRGETLNQYKERFDILVFKYNALASKETEKSMAEGPEFLFFKGGLPENVKERLRFHPEVHRTFQGVAER